MTSPYSGEITELLFQIEQGNLAAHDRLARLVRASLKRIAANRLRRERRDHLYQTSDLVQGNCLRKLHPLKAHAKCASNIRILPRTVFLGVMTKPKEFFQKWLTCFWQILRLLACNQVLAGKTNPRH